MRLEEQLRRVGSTRRVPRGSDSAPEEGAGLVFSVPSSGVNVRRLPNFSIRENDQLTRLDQPLAVALDQPVFGPAHRRGDHRVVPAPYGLPVRFVQGFVLAG